MRHENLRPCAKSGKRRDPRTGGKHKHREFQVWGEKAIAFKLTTELRLNIVEKTVHQICVDKTQLLVAKYLR